MAGKSWRDPTPGLPQMLQNTLDGVVVFRTLSTLLFQYVIGTVLSHFIPLLSLCIGFLLASKTPHVCIRQLSNWLRTWKTGSIHGLKMLWPIRLGSWIPASTRKPVYSQSDNFERRSSVSPQSSNARQIIWIARREEALFDRSYPRPRGLRHALRNFFRLMILLGISETEVPVTIMILLILETYGLLLRVANCSAQRLHTCPRLFLEHHITILRVPWSVTSTYSFDCCERSSCTCLFSFAWVEFVCLLRFPFRAPIRSAVQLIQEDVAAMRQTRGPREKTRLEVLLAKQGGAYKTSGFDSVFFQVYTGVRFSPLKAERRDLTVGLEIDSPPVGQARDPSARKRSEFWEHSKRLQSDHLIALVIVANGDLKIFLGTITSFSKDIAESAKVSETRLQIRASFFDPEVDLMALRRDQLSAGRNNFAILVDNSVMFESTRPFLEKLQTLEPTAVPFGQYITRLDSLVGTPVEPPLYTLAPRFKFNLQCLARRGTVIDPLTVHDPLSVVRARSQLSRNSELDPSQVDALINSLGREVALNQG